MSRYQHVEAYPLCWPDAWPRTPEHKRKDGHQFKAGSAYEGSGGESRYVGQRLVTFEKASRQLRDELGRLKATGVVLSTNARIRNDGGVWAEDARRKNIDPGVAVYFTLKGRPMVMAQDAYDNLASNCRSLGLAVEAMRALERHGGGTMMERAFQGFSALPPPEGSKPQRPWWEVLAYSANPEDRELLSVDEVEARFRTLLKKRHPDAGGSHEEMVELNAARAQAITELGGSPNEN